MEELEWEIYAAHRIKVDGGGTFKLQSGRRGRTTSRVTLIIYQPQFVIIFQRRAEFKPCVVQVSEEKKNPDRRACLKAPAIISFGACEMMSHPGGYRARAMFVGFR
uniref:Uncharacterized protein n=1 Tax=Anopheles atroparvus TaxID=41427 RepID=A0A182JMQ1_ANOAO